MQNFSDKIHPVTEFQCENTGAPFKYYIAWALPVDIETFILAENTGPDPLS